MFPRLGPATLAVVMVLIAPFAPFAPGAIGSAEVDAIEPSDVLVSVGSPPTPFPQSLQNAPAVAIDPAHPNVVAAAAADAIDLAACEAWDDPTVCPFGRVGYSGVYFSFDGGGSWMQPVYTGLTRRHCIDSAVCQLSLGDLTGGLMEGPIGTVPNFGPEGVLSIAADVAFGPVPDLHGSFSWDNGSRLYSASQIQNLGPPFEPGFSGNIATAVSTIDGVPTLSKEIIANQSNWSSPVIATRIGEGLVTAQPTIWVDNAETSPQFGNVYVCDVLYGEDRPYENKVVLGRSLDGGSTWTTVRLTTRNLVSEDFCHVRTDSHGTVYAFWEADFKGEFALWFSRSLDGGESFGPIRRLVKGCDPDRPDSFDGNLGNPTATSPSVDIANGAPSGADATDQIVLTTCKDDGRRNTERALILTSTDGGHSWSRIRNAAEAEDRPNLPTIAISPDGSDAYLVYAGYLDPWRRGYLKPRRMQAVVRHADVADLSTWITFYRGPIADGRASSGNSFDGTAAGWLGLYHSAAATRDSGIMLWTDIRNAERCPAIEAFRQSLIDGDPLPPPAPGTDCPPTFGNSDIYAFALTDPSP